MWYIDFNENKAGQGPIKSKDDFQYWMEYVLIVCDSSPKRKTILNDFNTKALTICINATSSIKAEFYQLEAPVNSIPSCLNRQLLPVLGAWCIFDKCSDC